MIELNKKIQIVQKKIDEEKEKIDKAEELIKSSKSVLIKYEKDLKELLKLKKKSDDFNQKLQDSLAKFDWYQDINQCLGIFKNRAFCIRIQSCFLGTIFKAG